MKRRMIVGAVLAVIAVGAVSIPTMLASRKSPRLLTAVVTRGDIEEAVVANGKLEPSQLVGVGAQVSGQVQALKVVLGQQVRKGDLIAQIDPQPQTNALSVARAELANAKAQEGARQAALARAELAFKRQRDMGPGLATSQAEYETAEAELKSARAAVISAQAQVHQASVSVANAEVNLGYTRIIAPIDGVVVSVVTKQGQTVSAALSIPTIVVLASLDTMRVKASVSEADVIKVKPGQPARFTILGDPDRAYHARLEQVQAVPDTIVNELGPASGATAQGAPAASAIYYSALFEVPNSDGRLRAMMTTQVSIILAAKHGVLKIPATALGARLSDGRYPVRVELAKGEIITRHIRAGLNNKVSVEVVEGLTEGDKVVVGETMPGDGVDPAAAFMGGF
ncbi:efflux RND transporter periplasmic adaptor subunit [Caulobacter segnis]|uniref:efflux RND transporter periplasmic adaptor subunit n=1 Tax=Caulobacter segnis TaxID=88688 RepID=UPI002865ADD2|nr:efflux RND transporter periplasmic adaptor subunit [Caulobacter segnis]MDR6625233.1 macrolide-specific efflux system membrane fusion protein [Caulobacter segnis]